MELLEAICKHAPQNDPLWAPMVEIAQLILSELSQAKSGFQHADHLVVFADITLAQSKETFSDESAFANASAADIEALANNLELLLAAFETSTSTTNDLLSPNLQSVPTVDLVRVRDMFIGRDSLVSSTVAAMQAAQFSKNLLCIYGPQGAGKTKFARVVASSFAGDNALPVFVSVRNKSTELIMSEIVHMLTPALRDTTSLISTSTLFYRATSLPGVVLVLQHATQPASIRPLVNACGAKHIVAIFNSNSSHHTSELEDIFQAATTNSLWGGAHVTHMKLGGLDDIETVECARQLCARLSQSEAEMLAKSCLNIPLAVVASAAILDKYATIQMDAWAGHFKTMRHQIHQFQLKNGHTMYDNENLAVATSIFCALQLLSKSILKILSLCVMFENATIDAKLLLFLLNQQEPRRSQRAPSQTGSLLAFRRERDDEELTTTRRTSIYNTGRSSRSLTLDSRQDEHSMAFDLVDITEGLAVLEEIGAILHVDDAGDNRFQCFRVHPAIASNWDLALDMGVMVDSLPPYFSLDVVVPARASKEFLVSTTIHKTRFVYHWFCTLATSLALSGPLTSVAPPQQQQQQQTNPTPQSTTGVWATSLPAQLALLHIAVHRQLQHITHAIQLCLAANASSANATFKTWRQSSEGTQEVSFMVLPQHFAHLLTYKNSVWAETLRMLLPSKTLLLLFKYCVDPEDKPIPNNHTLCLWHSILGDAHFARKEIPEATGAFQTGLKYASRDTPEARWFFAFLKLRSSELALKNIDKQTEPITEEHAALRALQDVIKLTTQYTDLTTTARPLPVWTTRRRVLLAHSYFHIGHAIYTHGGDASLALTFFNECRKILEAMRFYDHNTLWRGGRAHQWLTGSAKNNATWWWSVEDGILVQCRAPSRSGSGSLIAGQSIGGGVSAGSVVVEEDALRDADTVLIDPACEIRCLGQLGNVYIRLGEWSESLRVHHQGLELCKRIHDIQGEAEMNFSIGNAYHLMDSANDALTHHNNALALCQNSGNQELEAKLHLAIGQDLVALELGADAMKKLERGRIMFKQISDSKGEAKCFWLLGKLQLQKGETTNSHFKLKVAAELFKQSAEVYEQLDDVKNTLECFSMLTDIYTKLEDFHEAIEWCNKCISKSDGVDAPRQMFMRSLKHDLQRKLGSDVVLKCGWLTKQGGGTSLLGAKNWKRRWVSLTDQELSYYNSNEDTNALKSVKVAHFLDVRTAPEMSSPLSSGKTAFPIELDTLCDSKDGTKKRTFIFLANTLDDQAGWVDSMTSAMKACTRKL